MKRMHGMIAIVDALGARNYNEERIEKFVESRRRVLELLSNDKTAMQDRIDPEDVEVFTLNDAVIIAYNAGEQQPTPRQVRTFIIILLKFFVRSLSEGILFRGAIAIGDFYMNRRENVVMGPAVSDADDWYEKAEWIGVHTTPDTTLAIRQWDDHEIKPVVMRDYGVPLKDGTVQQAMVANWPRSFLKEHRTPKEATKYLLRLFCEHHIPLGTERKYFNTLEFFRSIVEDGDGRE